MINKLYYKLKREGVIKVITSALKYPFQFNKRKSYSDMLKKKDIVDRFNVIYEDNLWSSFESGSGEGSEILFTEPLRNWLVNNLPKLEVKNIIDASCGDYNWMRLVIPKLEVNYLGLDIVKKVIEKNNKLYSSDSVKFNVANICEDKIPPSDLIIIRDCLFHLSYSDIEKLLNNLKRTKYRYLLTTTHLNDSNFSNKDIVTGDFRLIDLFSKPLNFDKQLVKEFIPDYPAGYPHKKDMILIEKEHVPAGLSKL
tara:strand:- start:6392 stop:7150 length:759 start_codon:yes stop_codon:yes gene_type:complete